MAHYDCWDCGEALSFGGYDCDCIAKRSSLTKVTMPEPSVIWTTKRGYSNVSGSYCRWGEGQTFVPTDQAEAYADARVKEALEEAIDAIEKFPGRESVYVIRALIPKHDIGQGDK